MKSLHNFNGEGKSLFLIIMMAALLAPARMMGQETLTIYADGGDTQKAFIPFYGNYVNYYQKNEFIIPASKIVTMEDGVISKMTFYCTYSSSFDFACTFQVFMKEVSQSEFSNTSFLGTSGASVVYEGPLSRTSGPLEIDFTNNYTYHGGNLLIGFYVTETSSNKTTNYFYGETVMNSSLHAKNGSSLGNITSGEHENFLPMVTFEYTSADCVRPHYLEAKNFSSSAALLIWEPGSVDQDLWEIYYTTTANDVPDENTTATISNITSPRCLIQGLTENTKYYVYVRAVCGGEDGNSRWSDVCSFTAKDTYNLTICDGTATSQYVPFNYYNQHQYQKCEYIIPASKIGVMNGSVISAMTIYDGTSGTGYTSATFTIWLKEVDIETFSSSSFIGTDDATQVYQGRLQKISGSGGLWTVTFTNPYLYSGGNLLVCVYLTAPTSSQSTKNFKGENQSGTVALYKSGSGSIDNITTGSTSSFLPKTKFEYSLPCPMPSDLTVASLSPHTATLTWNEGFLESAWEIMVNDDDQNLISVEGAPTYTLTGLDAETTYSVKVRAACGGDDGNSAWTDAVDFTTLVACPMPTRFRLSNLGQHTATLNWTPGRDETSWLLAWSTDSDFNPDEATPIEITGTPVCAFSDLTPETNYYVYLRADCDEEGNSLWTDKFTFRTALYNPTLLNDDNPYYYDGFDEEPLEWEMANGGNHWMQGRSTCVSAPYAMYLSVSHSFIIDLSIATKSYVYKTFELEGGKQYEVSFDWRCKPLHSSTDFFEFRIYPAGVIFEAGEYPTGASAILSRRLEGSNKYLWDDHYETFQIPEGEGGSYVVVFSWKSDLYGSGGYYYDNSAAFDNFLINVYQGEAPRPTSPQPEPTEVTLPMEVLEVTPLAWQIIYSTDPELDPYTLDLSEFPDNLPEGVVGVETTDEVPTLQGLDPETGYYVYVRAIYPPVKKDEEERVFSRWSEQITFTTAVSCFPVEDLEATTVAADNATLAWNTDDQQPSANAPATWNVRYKKDVQAGTTTTYTFNDGKNPAAYVENWSVKDGSLISAGYTENNCIGFEIQLPCAVSFDAEGISHDVNYEVKACYDPQGNSVMASMNGTAVDGVSQPATFDFSDYGGTCYLVFSMSYQAPLLIDNLTLDVPVWTMGTANGNTFTINGLESKTDYLFAVQAHCGEGDDSQWVPASFRTAYGNLAIPYEEDFDGYSEGDLPEGWYSIENGQFPSIMDDNEITPHSSENCLVLSGSDESDQYAILPPAENVSSLQMVFWSSTPVSGFDMTSFTIGVMTDPEDAATFEPVKTFTTTPDWTKNVVYFDQYEGQGQYIAIQLVGAAETDKLLAIDDVEVSEAPSCFLPEALTVTDLTTSSAVVSWTPSGGETQWNISIKDMSALGAPAVMGFEDGVMPADWLYEGLDVTEDASNAYEGDWCLKPTADGGAVIIPVAFGSSVSFYVKAMEEETGYNVMLNTGADWQVLYSGTATTSYALQTMDLSSYSGVGMIGFDVPEGIVMDNITLPGEPDWGQPVLVENTPSYTFDNLSLGTSYEVRVQAVCAVDDVSDWVETQFNTPFCAPENQCAITYTIGDEYGDGWTGNTINIVDVATGIVVASITMEDHNVWDQYVEDSGTLPLCPGSYDFVWASGDWAEECSFTLSDPNGNVIVSFEGGKSGPEPGSLLETPYQHTCEGAPHELEVVGYGDSKGGYYLIASPVTVNPDDVEGMTDGAFDLYWFDHTATDGLEWRNYEVEGAHFDLVPGMGYLYAHDTDVSLVFDGEPYVGDGKVFLVKDDEARFAGWNLVGNPFGVTAYIDRDYYVLNGAGSELTPGEDNAIPAMQGLFVIAEEDGEEMQFSTEAPVGGGSKIVVNLTRNRGSVIDRAIVRMGEGRMLPKLQINPNNTKVFIPQGTTDYAVVSSGHAGEIPVSFHAAKDGSYTLEIVADQVATSYLHLIDNMTGADVDLLALRQAQGPATYTFNAKSTDYESRFKLVFATNGEADGNDDFAFFSNGNWVVVNEGEAVVQVIDMNGRILSSETINGSAQVKVNAACGLYVMRLVNGEKVKTQKIVVQ